MIILRCVLCDSERTFYSRSVTAATTVVCADCGGCSWEVLMDDGATLTLSTVDLRREMNRHSGFTWAYGSMGEYVDE